MADHWTYADWITKTDASERLTRLRLHIQEVSQKTIGAKTRTGAFFPVDPTYLKGLKDDEKQLTREVEYATRPGVARSRALCRRG